MAHILEADQANVRFGTEADICSAISDVRFAPNGDRESGCPQMCGITPRCPLTLIDRYHH